jgi:hypothetical protein
MSNIYYLRTVPADYDNMIAIGTLLGAIVHTPRSEKTYQREIYEEGPLIIPDDPELDPYHESIPTGRFETITEVTEESIYAPGGCWDYIGTIYVPTGETYDTEYGPQPMQAPLKDALGNEYIHVNLITPVNLREAAQALAAAHPEVAAGLANLGKYFSVDAEGNAIPPKFPHRVFAS